MNIRKFKQYALALTLGAGFVVASGLSSLSTVQAQDWRWEQQRRQRQIERQQRREQRRGNRQYDPNYGELDENGNIDRNQNGVDDRYENDPRYRNRNGGYYGNDGYYGNGGYYGNNNAEFQKGYREGLDRGMRDAQTNRAADPNNSSHYRKGNQAYREGFQRGFFESYRRYSNRGW